MHRMKGLKRVIFPIVLTALLLSPACSQYKKNRETLLRFAAEFESIRARYAGEPGVSLLNPEQTSALTGKTGELEALLKKYETLLPAKNIEAELLRSKVLLEMSNYTDARMKIDALIAGRSAVSGEAQMLKVLLLVRAGDGDRALRLFRQVEAAVPAGPFLYDAWLYFALFGDDAAVETFGKKLVETRGLPEMYQRNNSLVYRRMAALARRQGNLKRARTLLEKAAQSAPGGPMLSLVQAESLRLDFIGKPAPEFPAETWLNSPRLSLSALQGKPVVVVFWAPWCHSCQRLLPELEQVYRELSGKGLVVIGYTRLYGFFGEKPGPSAPLSREDEMTAIKRYIEGNRLTFPVALSDEGDGFETYHVTALPMLVLIDRKGNVVDTAAGAGRLQTLEKQINQLLEDI